MDPMQSDVTAISAELPCRRCGAPVLVHATRAPLTGRAVLPGAATCDACEALHDAELRAEEAARQRSVAEARRVKLLADLDVPTDFAWATRVDDIHADWGSSEQRARSSAAIGVGRQIVGELSRGLRPPLFTVFTGRPGNGKSLLAWTIAHELAGVHGRSALVVRLSALVRDLRDGWVKGSGRSERLRLQRYIALDYLAIDEVSRGAFYGRPQQHLLEVVNGRLERHRPTVITTNDDLAGLEALLGPQLMSRLATGGLVPFGDDEDRRQIAAQERGRTKRTARSAS